MGGEKKRLVHYKTANGCEEYLLHNFWDHHFWLSMSWWQVSLQNKYFISCHRWYHVIENYLSCISIVIGLKYDKRDGKNFKNTTFDCFVQYYVFLSSGCEAIDTVFHLTGNFLRFCDKLSSCSYSQRSYFISFLRR